MIKHCECLHPSVIPQNNQAVDVSLTVQVQTELRRRPPSASEIPHIKRMHTHEDTRQSLLHFQFLNYFSSVKVMASQDYLLPFPYSHIDIILSKVKASFAFPEPFCHNILRLSSWFVPIECWGSLLQSQNTFRSVLYFQPRAWCSFVQSFETGLLKLVPWNGAKSCCKWVTHQRPLQGALATGRLTLPAFVETFVVIKA